LQSSDCGWDVSAKVYTEFACVLPHIAHVILVFPEWTVLSASAGCVLA
jgi:hypothetical protein